MASEQHNPYGSSAQPQASSPSCSSILPTNATFAYGSVVYPTSLAGRAGSSGVAEASSTPPTLSPSSTQAAPLGQAGFGSQPMMANTSRMRQPLNLTQQHLEHELQFAPSNPGQLPGHQHQFQQQHHPHAQLHSQQQQQLHHHGQSGSIMTTASPTATAASTLGGSTQQVTGNLATQGERQTAPEVGAFSSGLAQTSGHEKLLYSSSYLANENYIAGMSSDSELTSAARGHHRRPYSSQSRVYHAHPAPRVNAAASHTSSRLSHYSDSAGYAVAAAAKQMSSSLVQQQQADLSTRRFKQQSSGSGRQLPNRPGFKQSMSIDQHQQQALLLARLGSPSHFSGAQCELAGNASGADIAQIGSPAHLNQQRWLSMGASSAEGRFSPARTALGRDDLELVESQTANLSLYTDRDSGVDKAPTVRQAAAAAAPYLPPGANPMSLEQQHQMHAKHLRQQSPINQHQTAKYEAYESQQSAKQHSRVQLELLRAHKVSSAPSQQSGWLPPSGHHLSATAAVPQSQQACQQPQGGRLGQAHFKQAMSIDHYASSGGHHYSPVGHRTPSLAANFDEHYRSSFGQLPAGYYQHADGPTADFGATAGQSSTGEYLAGLQTPLSQDNFDSVQAQACMEVQSQMASSQGLVLNSAPTGLQLNNYNNLPPTGALNNRQSIVGAQAAKLQHQFSSSSSGANSQSGSLKSSNLDLNKQTPPDGVQKLLTASGSTINTGQHPNNNNSSQPASTSHQSPHNSGRHDHLQHHHQRGVLKKGYTASTVSSSLAGSLTALNEPSDLSSSQATNSGFGGIHGSKRVSQFLS